MRDSLTILDQISSFTEEIDEEQVQNLLGMTDFGMLAKASKALITGNRVDLIEIIDTLAEQGADFRAFTKELAQFFRDLLVASVVKQPGDVLDLSDEEHATVKELVSASAEDQLTLMLSEVMKAEADVRNSSLPRMALEMALIRASFLSSLKPVKEVIENLDRLSRGLPAGEAIVEPAKEKRKDKPSVPANEIKPQPEETPLVEERSDETAVTSEMEQEYEEGPAAGDVPEAAAPREAQDIQTAWKKVLETIDAPLASKLEHAGIELHGDDLQIVLNGGHAVFQSTISENLGKIEKILAEHAGRKIRVTIATQQKETVRKKDLKEKALTEPVIKEALELFEGRIVDVIPIEDERKMRNGGDNV
jgi:DNA polymerase-3 subunit gamma/tau